MSSADRTRALQAPAGLHCVNCGGVLGAADSNCPWCESVPALVDVARLAQALDPEGATVGHAVHSTDSRHTALGCMACGAPVGADATWHCAQCGATLAAPGLAQAHRQISVLGPALDAHARKPAPHVVKQRLAAHDAAIQRQRDSAAQMQAEADAASGRVPAGWPGDDELGNTALPTWLWVTVLAFALWWWWT